jgi:hypothetical protein
MTTPLLSPVEAIWNEFCSWMVSQTLRKTSKKKQETDFRLLPALLEQFWDQDFPCPVPFLQALTDRLMQHGPFQRQQKQHPGLRGRLFSALLRLDAGRGLVLPFVEACLPHENDPEALAGLIESWPPGLVCPETIWQQWCEKTRIRVNGGDGNHPELRQLAWQALFQLPAPERDPTGSPHWLSFLRHQLKFETSSRVLESIWDSLNRLGMWPTSAGERAAWLAELERHSPCGSKASDRFVTRDALLREAIIWRVLFGMHVRAAETDASVLSRELLSRYLSDYLNYLNLPFLPLSHSHKNALSLLMETMTMLPAMESDRREWLATWEKTGVMTGGSCLSRKLFWEVMVRAQKAGLYPAEETMEAAIRALGNETDFGVFDTASYWVAPAGRLQKMWADLWDPHLFRTFLKRVWPAWRPAGDGYETFCSRLTEIPDEFRRTAARCLLEWHRTEMTQERWHAWWAQWVRQESDLDTLEELSEAMQHWQPLPEVIVSAWRERGQGGERDARVRRLAWQVLVSQPVDLNRDIIRHLPWETDPKVLETMAGWSPAATPVPADFWKEWGKKLATLFSSSYDDGSFLLDPLVTCCLKWRPATPDQIQEMWKMWEQILTHCPTDRVRDILKLLSNAPFLTPPASPYLLNLVTNERYKFDDIVRILNLFTRGCWLYKSNDIGRIFSTVYKVSSPSEGKWTEETFSFTGNISNPLWWEQQAEDMISQATGHDYWKTTACPERKDCLKSFQWICEHSPARRQGLLPGWNTLRPVLEELSASPEVELFFFSLVRKWGSPEGWQAWWEMAATIENRGHFVIPGGCSGMIRRLYLVERLTASLASCGEQADETTLRRLSRQLKQQWWRAEDVKLWPWLSELVEKAVAAGEGPGFRQTGSAVLSDRIWPLSSGLPAWEFRSTSGQVSDLQVSEFRPVRQASLFPT